MLLGKPESILSPNIREHLKGANFVHSNRFGLFLILYYHRVQILLLIIFAILMSPMTLFYHRKKQSRCFCLFFLMGVGWGAYMGRMVIIYRSTCIHLYTAVQSLSACWSEVKYKKKMEFHETFIHNCSWKYSVNRLTHSFCTLLH